MPAEIFYKNTPLFTGSKPTQANSKSSALGSINILGLNVCGLTSKLNLCVLEDYVCDNYDILCFSETKLDTIDEANINIDGFKPFYHHRKMFNRKSGGIAIFVKSDIACYVKTLTPCENAYVLWVEIDEKALGYELIIGAVYIPPPDSPYSTGHEYELILRDLIDFNANNNNSKVCIIGDMNSRTGVLPDFVETDTHLLRAVGLDEFHDELFVDRNSLETLGIPSERFNEDKSVDENGKKLIDLCINTGTLIVNGRTGKGAKSGRTTCKGVSTVDYVLASCDLFYYINDFRVDVYDKCLSDVHCPISVELNAKRNCETLMLTSQNMPPTNTNEVDGEVQHKSSATKHKAKWDQNKTRQFLEAFEVSEIHSVLNHIENLTEQHAVIGQTEVDQIAESIEHVYHEAGDKAGVIRVLHAYSGNNTQRKRQNRKSPNKPWFNDDCSTKRKEFYLAKNNFKTDECAPKKELMIQKSKLYRQTMKQAYKEYHADIHKTLRNLKSSNPKEYWNIINKAQGSGTKMGDITIDSFANHFKCLNENAPSDTGLHPESDLPENAGNELPFNQPITVAEIRATVKKLKNGKAGGIDQILNEFIKNSPPDMLKLITAYYNLILDTGIVPDKWTIGLIVPIFKNKGDINDPDNYRGITLLSCLGKLFTLVINVRLHMYLEANALLGEEQAGFREGYSTLDHIFSLHSVIDLFLSQKKRLYCAFIDYRKAFDTIDRSSLWLKLLNLNIKGKVLTVIKNIYQGAKSCVKTGNKVSAYFCCNIGVRQGENLSPLLFAIYLNDLEEHFKAKSKGVAPIGSGEETGLLRLFTLLYADDTILLSESTKDLQNMLNILHDYCQHWHLTVNTAKTKIVVFSRGKIRNLPYLSYGDNQVEVGHSYNYLGVLFNYDGRYNTNLKKQISQAKRAMFALLSKSRKLQLPLDLQCHLFDACIVPILLYGCEVWGFTNIVEIERVHNSFCKYILRLSPRTANSIALGELGRTRLSCTIKQRMVNFWARLATGKTSKISSTLFRHLRETQDTCATKSLWFAKIETIMNECGLRYILETPPEILDPTFVKVTLKDRITAIESQDWHSSIMDSGHCATYKTFKTTLKIEKYLTILNSKEAVDLCRYRSGNHSLPIITGRYNGIEKGERICPLCSNNVVGDEKHYIFICPTFEQERSRYIDDMFLKHPNNGVHNMEKLFTSEDPRTASRLSKFCRIIMNRFRLVKTCKYRQKKQRKAQKGIHTNTQEITERAKGTTSRLSERKSPKTPNAKKQIARKKKEKRTALEVGRTNRVTLMAENQEQHALQADKLPVPDG